MKTCRVCGEKKPLEQFRQGHNRCKTCTAIERKRYRLANLERETATDRRWYAANREAKMAYAQAHMEANRVEICARRRDRYVEIRDSEIRRSRRRYWADPEKRREAARRWARENPVKNAAAGHKRRAVRKTAPLTEDDYSYMAVLRRDPCAYCGNVAGTVDHIEPLNSGGSGGWANLTASCRSCNSSKSAAPLLAFLMRAK